VIFVRVGENHEVDPAVPRRDSRVERDEETIGVGPAVDQQAPAFRCLDEDGITLAHVEHDHVDATVRTRRRGQHRPAHREREDDGKGAHGSIGAQPVTILARRPANRRGTGPGSEAPEVRHPAT
jgi:hypothetical protein